MSTGPDEGRGRKAPLRLARPVWALLGLLALALGVIGVVLPVIPTTPFVIVAAFFFSRGSPRLNAWLEGNRIFGPILADWRKNGAIAPRYKAMAVGMMGLVIVYSLWADAPVLVLTLQVLLIGIGSAFILTRPNGP